MNEARNRRKASYQVLIATLWLTLLVLAVKVWAGWAVQSLMLLAESLHTLIDSFSVMLSLIAVSSPYRLASRELWGHGRRETAIILVVTAFLGFTGLSLLVLSIQQVDILGANLAAFFPVQATPPVVQLYGVIVAVSFCLTVFVRYEASVLESSTLRLSAHQLLRHAWLTLVIFMALLGIWGGYAWIDPIVAVILVVLVVPGFWQVLNWQIPLFIRQVAIAPEVIAHLVKQVEGVTHCYQIRSWGIVGRQVFIEMRLVLHLDFMPMIPFIAERIEGRIREQYGPVQVKLWIDNIHSTPLSPRSAEKLKPFLDLRGEPDWN